MPVTAEDLEQEFREEQEKKAKAKASSDSEFSKNSALPRQCIKLLAFGMACAMLMLVFPMQPNRLSTDALPIAISEGTAAKVESKIETQSPVAVDIDVPAHIRALAVELLGEADAKEFFETAVCDKRSYKKKELWFWHHKKDDLDFNPDVNYQFPKLRNLPNGSLAVDVGANLGDTPVIAYTVNQQIQIVSLEPSPYNYIFMRWNLVRNGIPELTEQDLSLDNKPGVLALHGGATKDGRSIELAFAPEQTKHAQMKSDAVGFGFEVPPSIDDSGTHQEEKRYAGKWMTRSVPSFALPVWLKAHKAKSIKWFKLDCEGCEYETLIDLEDGGFLKDAIVVGEAHYRHVGDLSCEKKRTDEKCKDSISQVHKVRNLMCKKYVFSCCSKIMPCDIFQLKCEKGRVKK